MLVEVFELSRKTELTEYYIGAGCIAQTVWNYLLGNPLGYGIDDIDIIYFDTDLSYEKEDRIINTCKEVYCKLPIKADVKNQARVHLWYKDKFGIDLKPYLSLEEVIDSWPTTGTLYNKTQEVEKNMAGIECYTVVGTAALVSCMAG